MAIPNALIEDRLRCIVMNYMKGPIEITVMEREEQLGQLPPNVFSFFYCLLAHLGVPSRKPSCNSGHFRQRYRESLPFTRIRTTKDQLILHLLEWGDTWKVRVWSVSFRWKLDVKPITGRNDTFQRLMLRRQLCLFNRHLNGGFSRVQIASISWIQRNT